MVAEQRAVLQAPGWAGYAGAAVVLGAAVAAALLRDRGGDSLVISVETLSARSAGPLQQFGAALPAGYAFAAGMVAAVNPCGFAMLPGYLALYLRTDDSGAAALPRAILVSGSVAGSFVVLFGVMGLALSLAGTLLGRFLPVTALLVGVLLVITGARILAGGAMYVGLGERLAGRLGPRQGQPSLAGYVAYGLAYGSTSVSCTLPVFLSVVGTSLVAAGFGARLLQFVLYGLGMRFVLALATVAVALLRAPAVPRLQALRPLVTPVSGLVLLLVGGYVVYYWLTLGPFFV